MSKKPAPAKTKNAKPVVKRKVVTAKTPVAKQAPTALDKKASLQQQIDALRRQMVDLDQAAIHELKLKLSDARKVVTDLEHELAQLTGTPKARRERRPSITDEQLHPQLLAVLTKHGKEGLNASKLAEHLHQDAARIRKFIADNAKVLKRTGNGAGTKFFLP